MTFSDFTCDHRMHCTYSCFYIKTLLLSQNINILVCKDSLRGTGFVSQIGGIPGGIWGEFWGEFRGEFPGSSRGVCGGNSRAEFPGYSKKCIFRCNFDSTRYQYLQTPPISPPPPPRPS